VAGLVGELGGGVDGAGEVAAVAAGLDEADVVLAVGVAGDCKQDASGVGRWGRAAVPAEPPPPPAAGRPPPPGTWLAGPAELVPPNAADTDELSA
jgi:hypothetical protein